MTDQILTQSSLKELLHYNPDTGVFTRLVSTTNRVKIGMVAGSETDGYLQIMVNKKLYRAHRLAWFYIHGIFPKDQLDQINGKRDDNRILNLREVTNAQNKQNLRKCRSDNKAGYFGVSFHKGAKKWESRIRLNGKSKYLGYFQTPELAHAAYLEAKRELHGHCTI